MPGEMLGTEVKPWRAMLPYDVVQVKHTAGRGPLTDRHVVAGTKDGGDHWFECELQAHIAMPRGEQRVLVHKLAEFDCG